MHSFAHKNVLICQGMLVHPIAAVSTRISSCRFQVGSHGQCDLCLVKPASSMLTNADKTLARFGLQILHNLALVPENVQCLSSHARVCCHLLRVTTHAKDKFLQEIALRTLARISGSLDLDQLPQGAFSVPLVAALQVRTPAHIPSLHISGPTL